jgi:hypothetical protein
MEVLALGWFQVLKVIQVEVVVLNHKVHLVHGQGIQVL